MGLTPRLVLQAVAVTKEVTRVEVGGQGITFHSDLSAGEFILTACALLMKVGHVVGHKLGLTT